MSSGSQDPRWQRWIPRAVVLAQVKTGGTGSPKPVNFVVPFPDSRLRVKITLLFSQNVPGLVEPAATLWLHESDTDNVGNLSLVPCTNIEGTQAAPTSIPADSGLQGYSREFVSAADYVEGVLNVFPNGSVGYWVLQTRYQPQSVSFSREEWEMIINQCNPIISSGGMITAS